MASIKKDEKLRKQKNNPYSAKNKLKMVVKSISQNARSKAGVTKEDYIPEEGYDHIKDRIAMAGGDPSSPKKKDATKYPPQRSKSKGKTVYQKEAEKKYGKGVTALDIVKKNIEKKHGKGAIMGNKK